METRKKSIKLEGINIWFDVYIYNYLHLLKTTFISKSEFIKLLSRDMTHSQINKDKTLRTAQSSDFTNIKKGTDNFVYYNYDR